MERRWRGCLRFPLLAIEKCRRQETLSANFGAPDVNGLFSALPKRRQCAFQPPRPPKNRRQLNASFEPTWRHLAVGGEHSVVCGLGAHRDAKNNVVCVWGASIGTCFGLRAGKPQTMPLVCGTLGRSKIRTANNLRDHFGSMRVRACFQHQGLIP